MSNVSRCRRCGNSIFELCPPCANVALLYAASLLKKADAEEIEAEIAYEMERPRFAPDLDALDF